MNFIATDMLFYITYTLLVIVSIRAIYLRMSISKQRKLHSETHAQLDNAIGKIAKLEHIEKKYNAFSSDLEQAAVVSKAQQTPRVLNRMNNDLQPPERYKYIHSLTAQGIAAAEIATILAISSQEADQLVALANISNR
jgi:hypothetical protein